MSFCRIVIPPWKVPTSTRSGDDTVRFSVRIISRRTVELTRRRESKHPSPHQVSYKTRSRRSRPTICYAEHFTTNKFEFWFLFSIDHRPLRAEQSTPHHTHRHSRGWLKARPEYSPD